MINIPPNFERSFLLPTQMMKISLRTSGLRNTFLGRDMFCPFPPNRAVLKSSPTDEFEKVTYTHMNMRGMLEAHVPGKSFSQRALDSS